jgi:hypothetical protein
MSMAALVGMRLAAFFRTGRILPSLLAALVVIGILYGGGAAPAAEAYGFSALALFPIMAWQAKLVLDTEPDVQRRLAITAVGRQRELTAGLIAASTVGLTTVAFALALPWAIGGIRTGDLPLGEGIALGVWAHATALIAAVGLGALASRALTRTTLYGVAVLVTGSVLAIVFGFEGSPVPWLMPPLTATARMLAHQPQAGTAVGLTVQAAAWTAVVIGGYAWLRRTRS